MLTPVAGREAVTAGYKDAGGASNKPLESEQPETDLGRLNRLTQG